MRRAGANGEPRFAVGEIARMDKLIRGFEQFRRTQYPQQRPLFERLASKQQNPTALFITCSDSRVNPNLFTQTDPGDLFLIRNAGNIVPPHGLSVGGEAATIEYSIEVLGIQHVVICGHSQCGAMNGLLSGEGLAHLPAVRSWCAHAESTRRIVQEKYAHLDPVERAVAAAEENVLVQMSHLSTHPCVATRLALGSLHVYGWYYDIGQGQIHQYDQALARFVELSDEARAAQPLPRRIAQPAALGQESAACR
jgi:carbonic anhydrase